MSAADLAEFVGAKEVSSAVQDAWDTAWRLVDAYLRGYGLSVFPPDPVVDRAVLETGAELYHRRSARNGISQFATPDTVSPMRIARDPLVAARPLLAPYLWAGGFA